jgi:hypothetical protein
VSNWAATRRNVHNRCGSVRRDHVNHLTLAVYQTADRLGDNRGVDIDYALAWNFVDIDGRPRQLRFRRDNSSRPDFDVLTGTGQLIAIIADPHRRDHGDTVAISRPGVDFAAVEAALAGWQNWAMLDADTVNLSEIRRRVSTAGLD